MPEICVFGEVLFDHFADGSRVLGGAPFNVAWHLQAFGLAPRFASRVGADPEGGQVREAMQRWGMDTACLQTDPERPTGRVQVAIKGGEPHYDIVENCAYDAIGDLATGRCDVLYHGTLAARAATSAATLRELRAREPSLVFIDVNLRPPWWRHASIEGLLAGAHWVKLNRGELDELYPGFPRGADRSHAFLEEYGLQGLILTHGSAGAEALTAAGGHWRVPVGTPAAVVDTVGAGDAFAAVMILGLVRHWPPALSLQRAQQFAAAIVGRRGATVDERKFYLRFLREWHIDGNTETP